MNPAVALFSLMTLIPAPWRWDDGGLPITGAVTPAFEDEAPPPFLFRPHRVVRVVPVPWWHAEEELPKVQEDDAGWLPPVRWPTAQAIGPPWAYDQPEVARLQADDDPGWVAPRPWPTPWVAGLPWADDAFPAHAVLEEDGWRAPLPRGARLAAYVPPDDGNFVAPVVVVVVDEDGGPTFRSSAVGRRPYLPVDDDWVPAPVAPVALAEDDAFQPPAAVAVRWRVYLPIDDEWVPQLVALAEDDFRPAAAALEVRYRIPAPWAGDDQEVVPPPAPVVGEDDSWHHGPRPNLWWTCVPAPWAWDLAESVPPTPPIAPPNVLLVRAGPATITIPGTRPVTITIPGLRSVTLLDAG
jgi:hypothetical protein